MGNQVSLNDPWNKFLTKKLLIMIWIGIIIILKPKSSVILFQKKKKKELGNSIPLLK